MAGIRYKGQIFSGAASFGDADHVAYDNTESGLEATDVQGALDEVSNAEGVSYDNTQSGLVAVQVQRAIDEIMSKIVLLFNTRRIFPQYTGSSAVTVLNGHGTVFFKNTIISARLKIVSNQNDSMNLPILNVNDPVPDGGDEFGVPGIISINKADNSSHNTYADLLGVKKWPNNEYYLRQNVTSTLAANDVLEVFFIYLNKI